VAGGKGDRPRTGCRRFVSRNWYRWDGPDDSAGYAPGSICNLQPRSDPAEVEELLEAMDLKGIADDAFEVVSAAPGMSSGSGGIHTVAYTRSTASTSLAGWSDESSSALD
jgi:hypothetical protein